MLTDILMVSANGIAELIVIDVGYPESFVWRLYYHYLSCIYPLIDIPR
jgi:hypothetical protein